MNEQRQPTEEELRAAYEAEIKKIRVEHVLLEHVVTLINLGMRRTGLAPGTEKERDPGQVQSAIEGVRAALPLLERSAPQQLGQIKEALSQLQLAFVKIGGESGDQAEGGGEAPGPDAPAQPGGAASGDQEAPATQRQQSEQPGPAQRSGKLWVPGQ
jgi:hypothetical protein